MTRIAQRAKKGMRRGVGKERYRASELSWEVCVTKRMPLQVISRAAAVMMAVVVVTAVVVSTPAMAESSRRQTILDSLVAANAGARQVSGDTVELPGGGIARVVDAGDCTAGWLCINDGWKYSGLGMEFFYCQWWNLGEMGWGDRIRSYANEQDFNAIARFYNWTGSSWDELHASRAKEGAWWLDDAPRSAHWTDAIQVC